MFMKNNIFDKMTSQKVLMEKKNDLQLKIDFENKGISDIVDNGSNHDDFMIDVLPVINKILF